MSSTHRSSRQRLEIAIMTALVTSSLLFVLFLVLDHPGVQEPRRTPAGSLGPDLPGAAVTVPLDNGT